MTANEKLTPLERWNDLRLHGVANPVILLESGDALAAEVARLERENERLRREANDWHLAYVERMGVTPE